VNVSGENRKVVIEPMADYSVLRVQQDVLGNSNFGGIFSLASQDEKYPVSTGGVDWRLFTGSSGTWCFHGQTVFSHTARDTTGYGGIFSFEKAAGKHFLGQIDYKYKDTKLDLNRLGYMSRNDEQGGYFWLQYKTNDDWWIVRNSWNNFNYYTFWNNAGYNIDNVWNVNTTIDFRNNWTLSGGYEEQYAKYDDRETRGNRVWKKPVERSWWTSLTTDPRKKISINLNPSSGIGRYGRWWAHWTGVTYCPASNISLDLGTNFIQSWHQIIWVTNEGDSSIFADLYQDEVELRFTASIVFTRDISCQVSGQGYISGVDYRNYRRYIGGEIYEPYVLDEEDFNYSALNSTLLFRWEYRPGSALYLVWTRAMEETDDTINNVELSRDMKTLFSENAQNVFLAKISYWWNL
jgi:hypothetical protein